MPPRNFGLRRNDAWRSFWDEPQDERDPTWPFWVIGAVVAMLVGIGIFIA
jgi:hypothetical protein